MTSGEKTPADVTELLVAWSSGDEAAMDELMPLVYAELRRIARRGRNSSPCSPAKPPPAST
jgi:ECF sigma factor